MSVAGDVVVVAGVAAVDTEAAAGIVVGVEAVVAGSLAVAVAAAAAAAVGDFAAGSADQRVFPYCPHLAACSTLYTHHPAFHNYSHCCSYCCYSCLCLYHSLYL